MFTFVSGNQTHAASTARLLTNLSILVDNQQKGGKNISILKLVEDPLFALPAKSDYQVRLGEFKDEGPDDRPCVYDGKSSYVDWVQTLRYRSLIVMGLKTTTVTPVEAVTA